jgi:dolichol kinase
MTDPTKTALLRVSSFFLLIVAFQVAVARLNLQREAKRRWQHAVTGHALVQVSYYLPVKFSIAALLMAVAGMWYLRTYQSDTYLQHFGPLLRPHELEDGQLPGAFYFLLGTAVTVALFPIPTARYAVECLALADPVAAWVGQSISSPKLTKSASAAGCIACFITAWSIGYVMLDPSSRWGITAGALACCLAEALPFGNDNLTIPLITSLAVQLSR